MHRVGKCFGVPIWKWKKTYVELWCCFSGVSAHTHPGQASEIVPLFGWAFFARLAHGKAEDIYITPKSWFRAFTVPEDCIHWFGTKCLIFLNISDRSAAENIVYQ